MVTPCLLAGTLVPHQQAPEHTAVVEERSCFITRPEESGKGLGRKGLLGDRAEVCPRWTGSRPVALSQASCWEVTGK